MYRNNNVIRPYKEHFRLKILIEINLVKFTKNEH